MRTVTPALCLHCGALCMPYYRGCCSWCWWLAVKGWANWADYRGGGQFEVESVKDNPLETDTRNEA